MPKYSKDKLKENEYYNLGMTHQKQKIIKNIKKYKTELKFALFKGTHDWGPHKGFNIAFNGLIDMIEDTE